MIDIGVVVVLILSLWSITKTLEKSADRIIEKQEQQQKILVEIKALLEKNKDKQ
jgi:ABC-type bacteriocin/lantibiotic exporter with double-glycine peptidase domain